MDTKRQKLTREQIQRHVRTHSERSVDDTDAVTVLKTCLRSDGRINTHFAEGDKWPNTDGDFELVPNPELSRSPKQKFVVQIKGTGCAEITKDNIVKYQLQSLAFPAYILTEVTADPGIIFLVLNPGKRGKERIFWKYMSPQFLSTIDFNNNSATIKFTEEEEIENTVLSVDIFTKQLEKIMNTHSFMKQLEAREYTKEDIIVIFKRRIRFRIFFTGMNGSIRWETGCYLTKANVFLFYTII